MGELDHNKAEAGQRITSRQALRGIAVALATAVAITLFATLDVLPRANDFREGDVSQYNLRSPRKLTYTSQVKTRAEKDRAAAAVPEILEIDAAAVARQRQELSSLLQNLSSIRNDRELSFQDRADGLARSAQPPFSGEVVMWLVSLDDRRWLAVATESQRLLQDALREKLTDLRAAEVQRELPIRVSDQLNEVERKLAVELASRFIRPNLIVNQEETARARKEARDAVAPVVETVEKGEIVLREGQVVTEADLEKLEALGLREPNRDWRGVGGVALLVLGLMGGLSGYIYLLTPSVITRERRLLLLAAVMAATVLAAKIVLPQRPMWVYVFPLPAVAMLLSTLLEVSLAVVVTAVLAVLVAHVAGGSLEVAAMGMVGGLVGAVAVWHRVRLPSYFGAGLLVALAQFAVIAAFHLFQRGEDLFFLGLTAFESLANGLISAALSLGTISAAGRIFGITTHFQLLELANPTQPLLRRLMMEAPGTYHHSIMVGNLAERAAEEVGADPLLVRVAAYYHDIGKLRRPYFFIENQTDGVNVHDALAPQASARIISAHVPDGLELARKYRLPNRIAEMIPQHHGTRLVTYFYNRALQQGPADPAEFSYSGPKPQSKEGAILMLADGVEAAARASRDHSPEAIRALVEKILMQRLAEGQLDDCDLTLRDLRRIEKAFVAILMGMYHPRIEYPEMPGREEHGPNGTRGAQDAQTGAGRGGSREEAGAES